MRDADENLGAVLDALGEETVVAVVSDHGFATNIGKVDIEERLRAAGVMEGSGNTVRMASGFVYFDYPDAALEKRVSGVARNSFAPHCVS